MPDKTLKIDKFTSSEAGAWSNSYLIHGEKEALLFDVFMLRNDAAELCEKIKKSGKDLKRVFISHAHPDHFMGTEVLVENFPNIEILSTPSTIEDIKADGPWMVSLLQQKLGQHGPKQLVVPTPVAGNKLQLEGNELEIVVFPEGESRHVSTLLIPNMNAHIVADLIYNEAHCYLTEKRPEAWLDRLSDLEDFCRRRSTLTLYPGHGEPGDPALLINRTRAYLQEFITSLVDGNATTVEARMLKKFPDYHAKQFLSAFTIPAYFSTSK